MVERLSRIPIRLIVEGFGEAEGVLVKVYAPLTVEAILRSLPIEGRAYPLKGGVYFQVPIKRGLEKPRGEVKAGAIAYWPMSMALCIFYQDTRPYSPVSVVGEVSKNLQLFTKIRRGTKVRVEKLET